MDKMPQLGRTNRQADSRFDLYNCNIFPPGHKKQFGGSPMTCAEVYGTEQRFSDEFINNFCYSTRTRSVTAKYITYYYWVPYLLLIQALAMHAPSYVLKESVKSAAMYRVLIIFACVVQLCFMCNIFGYDVGVERGNFPVRTLCDIEEPGLGQSRVWSVQCVLMSNTLYNVIYTLLFWKTSCLLVLAIAETMWLTFVPRSNIERVL